MTINLNNITDFFRPNRLIWQDAPEYGSSNADVDTDVDTDTDKDIEGRESTDDLTQVMRIVKQAESECDTAKKTICSLRDTKEDVWDVKEVNRLRKFIDELYDKFLVKGEGAEKMKYTSDRLKRLEQELDMETIIKELLNSKSYKIVTYTDSQIDKNPKLSDHILFEYKDGTKKKFPLEMSLKLPTPVSTMQQNKEADKEAIVDDKWSEYRESIQNMPDLVEEKEREIRRLETEERIRDTIERSKSLNTPESAYAELERIAPNLPEDLRNELSEPLSKIADIWSNASIENGSVSNLYDDGNYEKFGMETRNAILRYYNLEEDSNIGDFAPDVKEIAKTFGLD